MVLYLYIVYFFIYFTFFYTRAGVMLTTLLTATGGKLTHSHRWLFTMKLVTQPGRSLRVIFYCRRYSEIKEVAHSSRKVVEWPKL